MRAQHSAPTGVGGAVPTVNADGVNRAVDRGATRAYARAAVVGAFALSSSLFVIAARSRFSIGTGALGRVIGRGRLHLAGPLILRQRFERIDAAAEWLRCVVSVCVS
jgi:hypothetical protein